MVDVFESRPNFGNPLRGHHFLSPRFKGPLRIARLGDCKRRHHTPQIESAKLHGLCEYVGGVGEKVSWVKWVTWVYKIFTWVNKYLARVRNFALI